MSARRCQICRRLDGIPLAIELAAARVKALPVEQILHRLDDRFRLLTGGSRTALPRQQALRALIDWSYDLLSEPERALLRRLSVFAGGWTLEAAEAICADDEVLDLLSALVEKSLVQYEEEEEGGRYRLLETVRQYGRDRLLESGEGAEVRKRHAGYFLRLAETASSNLQGPEQADWFTRLAAEHDNLRAALAWHIEEGASPNGDPEAAVRMAGSLVQFWVVRDHFGEGRQWLEAALRRRDRRGPVAALPGPASPSRISPWVKALAGASRLAQCEGMHDLAWSLAEEGLALARDLGDRQGMLYAYISLAMIADRAGDTCRTRRHGEASLELARSLNDRFSIGWSHYLLALAARAECDEPRAREHLAESLAIFREIGECWGIAWSLLMSGLLYFLRREDAMALPFLEESDACFQQLGHRWGVVLSFVIRGMISRHRGDDRAAQQLLQDGLATARQLGDQLAISMALIVLGNIARDQGELTTARARYEEALARLPETRSFWSGAVALESIGLVAQLQGEMEQAARLWGAAACLRESIGRNLPPFGREAYAHDVSEVRAALGDAVFEAAWKAGRTMPLEQAFIEAQGVVRRMPDRA